MDAADFVGVNGGDGNRFDAKAFTAGHDKHFVFVIETVGAAEYFGNEMSMDHAKPALRVGNILSADATDLATHVTIDDAAQERHRFGVFHPVAEQERSAIEQRGVNKIYA